MSTSDKSPGTTRTQLAYKPGELAKVGQIWIIESLAEGELKTGKLLWDELSDHCTAHPVNIRIGYCEAASVAAFLGYLDDLRADIEATGRNAILQIECHGNDEGLGLADGSFLPWADIKPKLEAINLASRLNLILVLGCCYGGYFGRTTRLQERAAFCVYLGPNSALTAGMLADGLQAFYKALLIEKDITAAINDMVAVVPNMPYFFATADGLFHLGFSAYIRDMTTDEALAGRAAVLLDLMQKANTSPIPSAEDVAQAIKDHERPEFDRLRRHYFAIDLFPENETRFNLTYEDAVRASKSPGPFG